MKATCFSSDVSGWVVWRPDGEGRVRPRENVGRAVALSNWSISERR